MRLPASGKTTNAHGVARQIGAVVLEIDVIERASRDSGFVTHEQPDVGYRIAYRVAHTLAEENLRVGRAVIVDSVNPLLFTRDLWLDVARSARHRPHSYLSATMGSTFNARRDGA
jgi:predicted kinase